MARQDYEVRLERRRKRLLERAEQERKTAEGAAAEENWIAQYLPMGQPILVGHHSEHKHRRVLDRLDRLACKQIDGERKAVELERLAEAVGTGGISSDDPDAIDKLELQLEELERQHALMKEVNKAIKKAGTSEEQHKVMEELLDNQTRKVQLAIHRGSPLGFRPYQITNNSANIRRIRARIQELRVSREAENVSLEGKIYSYSEDPDENRVILEFSGKPSDVVRDLVKHYAFRWAPSRRAWVRQLSSQARKSGRNLCKELDSLDAECSEKNVRTATGR